ncbi:MAG TPA: class I SAM-dependent methyltransferase [Acidimicrobiales bacterium]|nr:class I SAM-dependent methyltransferase [Acidimicrobiales bacterium]
MREQRLVFGEDPDLYDRARPSYPAALVDDVVGMAGASARALDIGCGTGKATVLLAARGLSGTCVEADPAMAEVARRNLALYPNWQIDVNDFETWEPLQGRGDFDLACCAQAWHWLDPAVRLHKAHDLLRTGGWLALWWNRPGHGDGSAADGSVTGALGATTVAQQIDQVYEEVAPHIAAKAGIGLKGDHHDEVIPPGLSFGVPVRRSYPWVKEYTADEWVALLRTQSDHRLLPSEQLDQLSERVRQVLLAAGGVYRHHYVCSLWAVQKV